MREPILSQKFQWSSFKHIYLDDTVYEGWIDFWFTYMHKDVLVTK